MLWFVEIYDVKEKSTRKWFKFIVPADTVEQAKKIGRKLHRGKVTQLREYESSKIWEMGASGVMAPPLNDEDQAFVEKAIKK